MPLHDALVGSVATPMFMLLCGVGLLLLVACGNVAHLVLARSSERRHEMAVRRVLGASGARLAWQLVTESALLAAAGGALGLIVASWGLREPEDAESSAADRELIEELAGLGYLR